MNQMGDEYASMEQDIDKKMRDLQFQKEEILNMDIRHIQGFVWDFINAYEYRNYDRCGAILDILMTLSHNKPEIPTIQEYFGGEKIGRYKSTIHIHKASEWVTYIGELIKDKTEWKVQPEPIN